MEWMTSPWAALSVGLAAGGVGFLAWVVARYKLSLSASQEGLALLSSNSPREPLLPRKYADAIIALTERCIDHDNKLKEIERNTLERQMQAFEELAISYKAIFKKGFAEVCLREGIDLEQARVESRAFSSITENFLTELKDAFRKWFRANHYYEMADAERKLYVDSKIEVLTHLANQHHDDEWVSKYVPRESIYHIGEKYGDALRAMAQELFRRAFRLSGELIREINEEKAKYSAYVMAVAGHDPYDKTGC